MLSPSTDRPLKFQFFENPRWRQPPYWKIEKLLYLSDGLTSLHKIWHDDVECNVQIYIARLQKLSDALTAENKNVFSFAAKVHTIQFNIRSSLTAQAIKKIYFKNPKMAYGCHIEQEAQL